MRKLEIDSGLGEMRGESESTPTQEGNGMYGSVFGIAKMRVTALLAFALMAGIAFGRADAQLLPTTPQPQGGDIVGSWKAENISVKAYVPPALVTAVDPAFEGEANGTITFRSDGTVQADYTTLSIISATLLSLPIKVSVPDTSKYTGSYTVMSDTHQLVITREKADTLRYTYTATADSLFIMRPLLLDELLSALDPGLRGPASGALAQHVSEDDPIKIVIGFARGGPSADFTGDGKVDFSDFLKFVEVFGKAPGDEGYDARMDLDESGGAINFQDFLKFVEAFGSGG